MESVFDTVSQSGNSVWVFRENAENFLFSDGKKRDARLSFIHLEVSFSAGGGMESVRLLSYSYRFVILNEDEDHKQSPFGTDPVQLRHGPRDMTPRPSNERVTVPTPVPSALRAHKSTSSISGRSSRALRLSEMETTCSVKCRLYYKDVNNKLSGQTVRLEVSNTTPIMNVFKSAALKSNTLTRKKACKFRVYKVLAKNFKDPVELDVKEFRDAVVDDFIHGEEQAGFVIDCCGRMLEKYSKSLPIKTYEWSMNVVAPIVPK